MLLGIREERRKPPGLQLLPGGVTQHAHQRGVHGHDAIPGRADVDAFLQGLEELGEARFAFAQRGDVPGEHGDAVHLFRAEDGMRHAIEVARRAASPHLHFHHAHPRPLFEEARQAVFVRFLAFGFGALQKIQDRPADELLKRQPH